MIARKTPLVSLFKQKVETVIKRIADKYGKMKFWRALKRNTRNNFTKMSQEKKSAEWHFTEQS